MPSSLWGQRARWGVLGGTLLLVACSQAGPSLKSPPVAAVTPPQGRAVPVQANSAAEDQVLVSVSQALRSGGLLPRPDPCYAFRFDPGEGQTFFAVDVRENHTPAACGGDPQTQPHLFTVHVDKASRALSDDARTSDIFVPLQPQKDAQAK